MARRAAPRCAPASRPSPGASSTACPRPTSSTRATGTIRWSSTSSSRSRRSASPRCSAPTSCPTCRPRPGRPAARAGVDSRCGAAAAAAALERWFPPTHRRFRLDLCVPCRHSMGSSPSPGMRPNQRPRAGELRHRQRPAAAHARRTAASRPASAARGAAPTSTSPTTPGPETAPDVDAAIVAFNERRSMRPSTLRADVRLTQRAHVMHMTGADAALAARRLHACAPRRPGSSITPTCARLADVIALVLAARPVTRRIDERRIVVQGRRPPRAARAACSPSSTRVEWGIGADTAVARLPAAPPAEPDHHPRRRAPAPHREPGDALSGTLRRRFADDRLELEVRGLWEIERGALYLFPRVSYPVRERSLAARRLPRDHRYARFRPGPVP